MGITTVLDRWAGRDRTGLSGAGESDTSKAQKVAPARKKHETWSVLGLIEEGLGTDRRQILSGGRDRSDRA